MWFINDLECQNKPWFGSVASPHNPENYIVATGWAIDGGSVQHLYFNSKDESLASDWLAKGLEGQAMYVAHNATFEIQWLLKNYYDVFINWIKQGGRIFCTQYAEYILSGMTAQYAPLEDLSVKYKPVGVDVDEVRKIDEVKILWEQGVLTADIDKALLLSYLTDDLHGDIANTRRACFAQYRELVEKGMWTMFQKRMDSLLFNAIATFNGLYVDMDVANTNLRKQLKDIEDIRSSILSQLPETPDEFEFSLTSDYHLSAFLFGGTLNYDAKVSYDPIKYVKADYYYFTDGRRVLADDFDKLPEGDKAMYGERVTFKSGKNKGQPKRFREDTDQELLKWGVKQVHFEGLINFDELPEHVAELYTGKRAEFRGKRNLPCGTPVYSTSGDSLDTLAKFTDIAKPISMLNTLIKDTGTYYIMEKKGKVSGMLQYVEPDGIVHHQLNNCATITGRLSSSRPNFQNLPRGDGDESKGQFKSRVKEMFRSRFGDEGRIVEVDYTALEVVNAAAITGDKNLQEQLLKGTDMHCYRLAFKEGLPYEEVLKRCKDPTHPDHLEWSQKRSAIKTPSFADQYGASEYGVAYAAGCSVEFAREFQENEAKLFPQLKAYPSTHIRPEVERTGLESLPQREYIEESGWSIYRTGYFTAKSGTRYTFRQYPQRIEGQTVMDYKPTQLANYPFQGESAFIVQTACGHVIRWLIENDFFGGQILPINTVHDAIYLDCATEELAIFAGRKVREIMAEAPKRLAVEIPALREWGYDIVPFPAAAEQGIDMGNKDHID